MRDRTAAISLIAALTVFAAFAEVSRAAVDVAVVGDCEKLSPDTVPASSNYMWDGATKTVRLHGARNEVIAFQIVVTSDQAVAGGDVEFADLKGPGAFAAANFTGFLELYQKVTRGWSASADLPVGLEYPDPLVPLYDPYAGGKAAPVAAPFKIEPGRNAIVWVDCWIPPDTKPGAYKGTVTVLAGGTRMPLLIDLTVWDFNIPAQPHIYNFTELYRWEFEYHEKAKWGFNRDGWPKMTRYEDMLLQHRLECSFTRLWPDIKFADDGKVLSIDWTDYDKYVNLRFDGTFVKKGPVKGEKPALWYFQFTPIWPNNPELKGRPVDYRRRGQYEENVLRTLAREVAAHWRKMHWTTPVVAAVLDESQDWETILWAAKILHEEGGGLFKYMNTGHYGVKPQLVGYVDIWSPNAQNYDPEEMVERIADGDMTWFYHWCEPWIGHMVVNSWGISMRTWDAAAFKYGVDGTYLWTCNNWPHPDNWRAGWGPIASPYVDPAGANGGERFGNGTYVYPGAALPDVGFKAIDGPVASVRLKAMRRGAQDYEYLWILQQRGRAADARALKILSKVMRSALVSSSQLGDKPAFTADPVLPWTRDIKPGQGDWSHNAEDWHAMRLELARAITGK